MAALMVFWMAEMLDLMMAAYSACLMAASSVVKKAVAMVARLVG